MHVIEKSVNYFVRLNCDILGAMAWHSEPNNYSLHLITNDRHFGEKLSCYTYSSGEWISKSWTSSDDMHWRTVKNLWDQHKVVGAITKIKVIEYHADSSILMQHDRIKSEISKRGPCESVLVCHGTNKAAIDKILSEGFKIGGIGGHRAVNGSSYGFGVYTSVNPSEAKNYSRETNKLLICSGIQGREIVSDIRANDCDSWRPTSKPSWILFKEGAQLLPRYIVSYK